MTNIIAICFIYFPSDQVYDLEPSGTFDTKEGEKRCRILLIQWISRGNFNSDISLSKCLQFPHIGEKYQHLTNLLKKTTNLKMFLVGKWDEMLQWLSDIVPLCSARHDVCSWLPYLPCQVWSFFFLWMLKMIAMDFGGISIMISFEYISIPCHQWQDPMVVATNTDDDVDVDDGNNELDDIPGQLGHQRSQILFSCRAHCDPGDEERLLMWLRQVCVVCVGPGMKNIFSCYQMKKTVCQCFNSKYKWSSLYHI